MYYDKLFLTFTIATTTTTITIIVIIVIIKRLLPSLRKTCTRPPHLYTSSVDSYRFRTKAKLYSRLATVTTKDSNTWPATGMLENSYRCLHFSSPSFVANATLLFQIQTLLNLSLFRERTLHLSRQKTQTNSSLLRCAYSRVHLNTCLICPRRSFCPRIHLSRDTCNTTSRSSLPRFLLSSHLRRRLRVS